MGGVRSQAAAELIAKKVKENRSVCEHKIENKPFYKRQYKSICFDSKSKIGKLYGASQNSSYLIRPDMHIVGRWFKTNLSEVLNTFENLLNGVNRILMLNPRQTLLLQQVQIQLA